MSTPIASIILLAYNHKHSFSAAVESLLAQKCSYPYEIIIADDGSTDGTRELAEEYAERFPDIIRLTPKAPNKGVVDNYFDALSLCRGKYISDCAADDHWLDPALLTREIEILESDPELTVVFPDVAENGVTLHSRMPEYNKWMRPRVKGKEILLGTLNNTTALPYQLSASLYRKEALMRVLADAPEMVRNTDCGVEDVPVIAALASQGDAAYLPIVGYYYSVDDTETLSNNLTPAKAFRFYSRLLSFTPKLAAYYGVPLTALKRHFDQKYRYIAAMARKSKERSALKTLRDIRKAWRPLRPHLNARINSLRLILGI